jgi:hypothetical protein
MAILNAGQETRFVGMLHVLILVMVRELVLLELVNALMGFLGQVVMFLVTQLV